ncbi:terminase gpA endonuclease subunit [Hoeflea sp. BAL378]|uniref:terminase gpA endonuclease subunit n=1 Tax=Hoeflea sp. BAL378 TaxID=1547437 RepID=UPI00068FF3BD|nr:terminase gpA endonuclease subunit [Hoeflea sp. BAL378]
MTVHPGALKLVASRLAEAIRPHPPTPFVEWLSENVVLVDGPRKGELWSPRDAPYLVEIAECLSQEHSANLVTVRKAQQTGVSILALSWCLYIAEVCPDNILYGVPGIDALQDINGQKLQPLIDAWQVETDKKIILPVTSRSGRNSTTYEKRFPGGYISLANANTVMDLSMKTCRFGVKDEVSKWGELPNGADPETLFFGRFTAFRRQRSYKIFELSTPELDSGDALGDDPGHCRIDRSFKRSDQRFWYVECVECKEHFVQSDDHFHVDRVQPHKSVMVCPSCGHWISEAERVSIVREGAYRPTQTGPDRHPGFHVDAFMSLLMSLGDIAEDKLKAEKRGEAGAKDYHNLVLALPYQLRGNAPDWQRLMERREDYPDGVIPADGLIFVAGADVQHSGIYVEFAAFGSDRQSWSVHAEFLEGETDDKNAGAWVKLDRLYQTDWQDAYGHTRRAGAMAVDAGDGNRTTQVLEWCRERPDTYAIAGKHGRGVAAIGLPKKTSVRKGGKRKRVGSTMLWPVGTWSLKGEFYGNLHRLGLRSGEVADPAGYCHFNEARNEEFFRQITAEYFDQKMVRGRLVEEWKKIRRDNHFLDARIYAMAMAEHLGLSRLTPAGWAALRAQLTPAAAQTLFTPVSQQIASRAEPDASSAGPARGAASKTTPADDVLAKWKRRK